MTKCEFLQEAIVAANKKMPIYYTESKVSAIGSINSLESIKYLEKIKDSEDKDLTLADYKSAETRLKEILQTYISVENNDCENQNNNKTYKGSEESKINFTIVFTHKKRKTVCAWMSCPISEGITVSAEIANKLYRKHGEENPTFKYKGKIEETRIRKV